MVLIQLPCLTMQAQSVAPDDADHGTVVSISSSEGWERNIIAAMTPYGNPLPDSPIPVENSSVSSSRASLVPAVISVVRRPVPQSGKFNLKAAFWQSFSENLFYHAWRVSTDPGMRWNLAHKPFFHDWFASYKGYNMHRWGDGDDFIVNLVGHPLEGAVFGRTFLQNSPNSQVPIGKNSRYWTSRLKATAWAAAWSTQLEIGPISETSFGNQGGVTYVPGCGNYSSCLNNPKFHKPPTNNTGWSDFVMTPLLGTAWIMAEDTIDKYIVTPVAVNHRIIGGRALRAALEPSRSFAAIFAGKFPWDLPSPESSFVASRRSHLPSTFGDFELAPLDRFGIGTQYSNISLPVVSSTCSKPACRKNLSGFGSTFDYNFTRAVAFDSTLNFIPRQQGTKAMLEGLFGVRIGARFERFGIFAKVRPGFISYESALTKQGASDQGSLTRFAADLGGIVEYYPKRNTTWRVDVGTTLVRYLTNQPDPHTSALGSLLSPQYIVTQGNFQMSTSYMVSF
ncbi:MAG TPA: hypothetical protein VK638_40015 [Edaphobacter sp.]|nr:hypothetical protein [Edaphobacter sp.]